MDSSGDICGTHDDACSHCCCHGFVQSDRIYDDRLQSYNSWFTSMDGVSIMLIAAPLMVPVVGGLGYDLIQFGIVMTIGIQVGQLTPPVGINLFQVAGMQKESVASVIRGAVPFLLLLMVVWVLVIFCPGLTAVATTLFT